MHSSQVHGFLSTVVMKSWAVVAVCLVWSVNLLEGTVENELCAEGKLSWHGCTRTFCLCAGHLGSLAW